MNNDMVAKISAGQGFVAALDQSGGSSPKALAAYGVDSDQYSNDDEMFDQIHQMRCRIMTSPAFSGDRVVGAILFEATMDRDVNGVNTVEYLWSTKSVVPFLKVDQGLADENNGVQVMKPMPGLGDLLARAQGRGVFGTKMRSVIKEANEAGVAQIVAQQVEVGNEILAAGLVPILEPEVDINSPSKAQAEDLLREGLVGHLDAMSEDSQVMLKLTLPEQAGFYDVLVDHPRVMKVVALSGGYSRDEANAKLAQNRGIIASFSRALTEGLSAQQSDDDFNATLDGTIESIYQASIAG